jgi:NarL family two-component system response regulator LiaR
MASDRIRVLIVEDHTVVRKGLCSLLSSTRFNIDIVGEAADGIEAVAKARELEPDVILMDLILPQMNGIEATQAIRARNPQARILILTSFGEEAQVAAAMKAGALGYLLKESTPEELVHAIESVHMGRVTLPADLAGLMLTGDQQPAVRTQVLTPRELDVLQGIATGLSNQEIAESLSISPYTVRTHVRNILGKLKFTNRTQAAMYAVQVGLATPDPP